MGSPTLVEIPNTWSLADVSATGATIRVQDLAGGARLAKVTPDGTGAYEVMVSRSASAGRTAASTAKSDAANPLAPISYATALGDLQAFITSSEHSPDKSVSSNAALVAVLAESVLGTSG